MSEKFLDMTARLCSYQFLMESLILAQNERWRRG